MFSLDMYGGKLVLLSFFLLVRCLPPVWSAPSSTLGISSSLKVGATLVSPSGHFELGIFQYAGIPNYTDTGYYYLCIRYAAPIEQVVTWVANRDVPLSSNSILQFSSDGALQLFDQENNNNRSPWSTSTTANTGVANAQLLDTGNLVLMNKTGVVIWDSFIDSPPTDTLLPGQYLHRNASYQLSSWQKNGSPASANGTYSFGWDDKNILTLSWTSPKLYLNWKGGPYIPAPDVYDAHTISNVDYVYFHATLGHLYISSTPANTAILSGGPDPVNATTLKRITISSDGGFRILQWTIGNSTSWTAMANWVVSDRPDSRSQCTSYGTCGPYGMCISPIDSLEPVICQCPPGFTPVEDSDLAQGCNPPPNPPNVDMRCSNATEVGMLELDGVDMPWGGDYKNLTGNESADCREACLNDCYCAGAVFSSAEQKCWLKTGILYNLGYPTVALHGNDRISYLKNSTVPDYPNPPVSTSNESNSKLVKIVVPAVVGVVGGGFLILALILCLCYKDKFRERVQGCRLCCWRAPPGPIVPIFPRARTWNVEAGRTLSHRQSSE